MPTTMELKPSGYPHIVLDERGRSWIENTTLTVMRIVGDVSGVNRMTPEQVAEQYARLTLSQVHSALAYYYDHKRQIDAEIAKAEDKYLRIRAETENHELQARLAQAKARWLAEK